MLLRDDDTPSLDLEPADGFEQLLGAAVHYRIATGPHTRVFECLGTSLQSHDWVVYTKAPFAEAANVVAYCCFSFSLVRSPREVAEAGPMRGAMQASSGVRITRTGDVRWRVTALVHGMTVVTRNIADFGPSGVETLNPWE